MQYSLYSVYYQCNYVHTLIHHTMTYEQCLDKSIICENIRGVLLKCLKRQIHYII